jgi:hypothetical protein
MNFSSKPFLVLKAAFHAIEGTGWDYAKLSRDASVERFDGWMQNLADNLPERLAALKGPFTREQMASPANMTGKNWHKDPAVAPVLDSMRKEPEGMNIETWPMHDARLTGLKGYKALQQACDKAGVEVSLTTLPKGYGCALGVDLRTGRGKWPSLEHPSLANVGKALIAGKHPRTVKLAV